MLLCLVPVQIQQPLSDVLYLPTSVGSQLVVRSALCLRVATWSLRMLHTFCSRLGIHERASVLL